MRVLCFFVLGILVGGLVIGGLARPATAGETVEKSVEISVIRPLGDKGLFKVGTTPELQIKGNNSSNEARNLSLEVTVTNFFDKEIEKKNVPLVAGPNAAFDQTISLPEPEERGFFSVILAIKEGEDIITTASTSFVIMEPVKERDHFFKANANANDMELVPEMQTLGITVRSIPFLFFAVPPQMRGKWAEFIELERTKGRHAAFVDNIELSGDINLKPPEWFAQEIKEKKEKREFPYSEEFFTEFGDFVEAVAVAYKGKIKLWAVGEEIDAVCSTAGDYRLAEFEKERYIRQMQIVHERLKKVDPDCKIAALCISLDSENSTEPRFSWTKRSLLPKVDPYFEIFAPDAYCGPWFITNKNKDTTGPEKWKFRDTLLDAARLQQSRPGKHPAIAVNEKGLIIPYHVQPDDELEKLLANHTARNLILAKSVPETAYVSHYLVCSGSGYRFYKKNIPSTDDNPIGDEGLWKMFFENDTRYYRPRSAVAAFATVARQLAHATDPEELNPRQGIYNYLFTKDGKPTAALWTTEKKPVRASLQLPCQARLSDLMGNEHSLEPGEAELTLSESPQFLTLDTTRENGAAILRGISFPDLSSFSGEIRLKNLKTAVLFLTNKGSEEVRASVKISSRASAPIKEITVPARSTIPVEIQLPAPLPDHITAEVKFGARTYTVSGSLKFLPVRKVAGDAADGDFAKYKNIAPIVMEGIGVLFPSSDVSIRGDWTDNADLSAKVWLTWDDKYLRFAAEVKDDSHLQNDHLANIWKGDCIQFAINPDNDALMPEEGNGQYGPEDYSFGMALGAEGPVSYCWVDRGKFPVREEGSKKFPLSIQRDEANGITRYETAIPWKDLAPLKPETGRAFRFNFAILDKDASEKERPLYWMGLTPGIVDGIAPYLYKTFVLAP